MSDRRQQLINVFQDTQKFYTENKTLSSAVSYGRQNAKLDEADDYPQLPAAAPKPGGDQVTAACAAPNRRNVPSNRHNPETGRPVKMDSRELYTLHVKRAKHILHIAAANEADILILGAFGCGAFQNDPDTVAEAYGAALEEYRDRFHSIVFAIYCGGNDKSNFSAFEKRLGK